MDWTNYYTKNMLGQCIMNDRQAKVNSWIATEGLDKSLSKSDIDEIVYGISYRKSMEVRKTYRKTREMLASSLRRLADFISPEVVTAANV